MPEASQSSDDEGIGHRIARAMFVVIFFHLFWKFGGLIITVLVGSVFEASPESDAYLFVSETVVFLLQTLCLKVFIPVVVPIFKEQLAEQGEAEAWRFGSTVLWMTVLLLALVTVGGMLFAPTITSHVASGFNARQSFLTARLMRIMFPGVFAICLATVTYALLNSYNIFGYAAAGDALQKMLWAGIFFVASLTGLAVSKTRMLDALAVAFLLGAAATLLTHLTGLRKKLKFLRFGLPGLSGRRVGIELGILAVHLVALAAGLWAVRHFAPVRMGDSGQQGVLVVVVAVYLLLLWWRAKGRGTPMAKFAALAVPLLFGILFAKYRDVLTNLFASFTGTGVFSDLKYARKVGEAPNTLVIAALSIAILPHLCELATGKKWTEFGQVMTRTIRIVVIFFVPLAALTVVLRQPVIQLLFDRGTWDDYHLIRAGDALGLYILSLPFFAIENPIQQSFFAMQRMWTPTLIGFIGSGFHILFLFVGIEWLGFGYFLVVALVYAAARAFKNVILLLVMRYHVKILPWKETLLFLGKAAVITAAIVAVAHYTYAPIQRALPLEPYRTRQVMVDTFNVEPRGWESENVDEFRIVDDDAPVLQDAFPQVFAAGETPVPGEKALMARYRRSPRRTAGLRLDVSDLDLTAFGSIVLGVAVSEKAELAIELVTVRGEAFRAGPLDVAAGSQMDVAVAMPAFGAGERLPEMEALWIRDATPVDAVAARPTVLALDRLAFRLVRPAHGEGPAPEFHTEHFEPTWNWVAPPGSAIKDTGERRDEPELALHVPPAEEPRELMRSLAQYRLRGWDSFTFKAKADAACELGVALLRMRPDEPTETAQHAATVALRATDTRASYSIPLDEFGDAAALREGRLVALEVSVPAGVDLWLDNIAFVREPAGPRFGSIALMYEAGKLVHVAVPSLAALVVFVVLLIVLRVEDAESIWAWLKQRVFGPIAAKLGRGGKEQAES